MVTLGPLTNAQLAAASLLLMAFTSLNAQHFNVQLAKSDTQ